MESPPSTPNHGDAPVDASKPFKDIVLCCTSIPPDQRVVVANQTAELGGIHKYDLTPDVTHLIVGDYDTPKYRHVAKERPDIAVMALGWIDAVLDLWTRDAHIDLRTLVEKWRLRPLETDGGDLPKQQGEPPERGRLLCCLTGFDDGEREHIIEKIVANGGDYTGTLVRNTTHLIAKGPGGPKYAAAKSWCTHIVSAEWLYDSVARGMILDETKYDPTLPKEERGKGAWNRRETRRTSMGKRTRENETGQEDGKRKLRKTASVKLTGQSGNLWGDILGRQPLLDSAAHQQQGPRNSDDAPAISTTFRVTEPPSAYPTGALPRGSRSFGMTGDSGVFSPCLFYIHGFGSTKRGLLANTVTSLGGELAASLDEIAAQGVLATNTRLIIVPQESRRETHPPAPTGVHTITEFFIEKCMHKKQLFDPSEHVIGRPFATFPIDGFQDLVVSTSGFTGVDLNQMDKMIRQLGARYEETFTAEVSLLLVLSPEAVRKQKLELAMHWKVPVVNTKWLWECISSGRKIELHPFLLPPFKQSLGSGSHQRVGIRESVKPAQEPRVTEPAPRPPETSRPTGTTASVFTAQPTPTTSPARRLRRRYLVLRRTLRRAPTHQPERNESNPQVVPLSEASSNPQPVPLSDVSSNPQPVPLSEASSNHLNRAASPKKPSPQARKPMSRVVSEIADSETTASPLDAGEPEEAPVESRVSRRVRDKVVAAAERMALSTKLTALLEPTAGGSLEGGDDAGSAARPRRRRGIMGRAVSNVSVGSNGSAESAAVAVGGSSLVRAGSSSISLNPLLIGGLDGSLDANGEGANPPSTQLGYEGPDARRYKAELLNKMMAGTEGGEQVPIPAAEPKVTLKDLKDLQQGMETGQWVKGVGTNRRTTRRR